MDARHIEVWMGVAIGAALEANNLESGVREFLAQNRARDADADGHDVDRLESAGRHRRLPVSLSIRVWTACPSASMGARPC